MKNIHMAIIAAHRLVVKQTLHVGGLLCYACSMNDKIRRLFLEYIVGDAIAPSLPRSIRAVSFLAGGAVGLALEALTHWF